MVPAAIPALNLEIDSNNDGSIDLNDEAIEANPNYPGKIIPLGDASADPAGTELRVVPNYSDSSDTVTFDFDDSAMTVALPGSNGTISPEDEFTWAQLSPMFSYGVLVLHVWGLAAGPQEVSATATHGSQSCTDTVNLSVLDLNLTACRTGGNWGQAVDETTQDGHNPDDYVVLVNNDFEQNSPLGNDLTAYKVTIPTSTTLPLPGNQDDDLIKLTLSPPPEWLKHGELQLNLSNLSNTGWSDLRIFDDQGNQIYDGFGDYPSLRVNLDHPEGPLAALADGDPVTLYAEAKTTDGDLAIYYDYVSAGLDGNAGALSGRDRVDMRLAAYHVIGSDGYDADTVQPISKAELLYLANNGGTLSDIPADCKYKIAIDGLPPSIIDSVVVTSATVTSDSYTDEADPEYTTSFRSENWAVVYRADADDVLSGSEKALILANLGVNAVHNSDAPTVRIDTKPPPATQVVDSLTARAAAPSPTVEASTISHNSVAGELAEHLKRSVGAYVPVNNDDDDYQHYTQTNVLTDKSVYARIPGEDDLLPITVHNPQPRAGVFRLRWAGGSIFVWRSSEKGPFGQMVKSGAEVAVPAGSDLTLYVEGIVPGDVNLNLDWLTRDGKWRDGTDWLVIHVFNWLGPLNVPEQSIYRYTAEGVPTTAHWGDTEDAVVTSVASTVQSTKQADFFWRGGPLVGKAPLVVDEDYAWDLKVNIVAVTITGGTFTPGVPFQNGFAGGNRIRLVSGKPGLSWSATVELHGPDGDKGKKQIRVGFIQNLTSYLNRGWYPDGTRLTLTIEVKPSDKPILDQVPGLGSFNVWYSGCARQLYVHGRPGSYKREDDHRVGHAVQRTACVLGQDFPRAART